MQLKSQGQQQSPFATFLSCRLTELKTARRTPQARRKWPLDRRSTGTGFTATWPAFFAGLGPAVGPARRTPALRSVEEVDYGFFVSHLTLVFLSAVGASESVGGTDCGRFGAVLSSLARRATIEGRGGRLCRGNPGGVPLAGFVDAKFLSGAPASVKDFKKVKNARARVTGCG